MDRLSDRAIEILNNLHTERLEYNSEYLPLIEAAHKLAEYEATGLEPSEIQWRKEDLHILDLFKDQIQDSDETIRIAEARRDGRLAVLPCKVGDVLFVTDEQTILPARRTVESITWWNGEISIRAANDRTGYAYFCKSKDFGKTVFLTREEAESTLKTMQEAGA